MTLTTPLAPRAADGVLRVVIPGRISTPGQDPESIAATQEDAEAWLKRAHPGPTGVVRLGEQASGWLADRDTMVRANGLIEAGECDLVLVTELREVYRNPKFQWAFVQTCLDHDVRFVSIADGIDTAADNWEVMMHLAAMRHGMTVPETRRRVRRKATYTFSRGGMVLKVKYGYRKLTEAEAASGTFGTVGLRIAKRTECTQTLHDMRGRVVRGESYAAVADRLNDEGVAPGPYVGGGRWTGRVVKDLLRDPVLSGRRRFRATIHRLVYKTGKHRTEPNPDGPEVQEYPELAHFTAEEQAELLVVMDARRAESRGRQRGGKDHPLWRQARKRSLWPGQHATCGACGGRMYRCGRFLRCRNTLPGSARDCWNRVQVDIEVVHAKVLPWVVGVLDGLPGFRDRVVRSAWAEFERACRRHRRSGDALDVRIGDLDARAGRLAKAISAGGPMDALLDELAAVQGALTAARGERDRLADDVQVEGGFTSADDVAARLDEAVRRMARTSRDFADLLRRLVPVFVVRPVQQLDRPQVRARAELTLRLDAWAAPDGPPAEASVTLDLFEPPAHVRHLRDCTEAERARPGASLRELAAALGVGYMTVKRAMDYARLMEREGADDPYRVLLGPPAAASRWGPRDRSAGPPPPPGGGPVAPAE